MLTTCHGMNTHTDEPTIGEHLTWIRDRGARPNTVLSYRTATRDLARHSGRPLLGLLEADLDAWRTDIGRRLGPSTVRGYVCGVRSYYLWAVRRHLLEHDPAQGLEVPRAPRRLPRPLPDVDVERALEQAGPTVGACIGLERYAGLRCCEVASLGWEEVTLGPDAHLRVVAGKGAHERVVDIAPRLEDLLRVLPGRSGPVVPRGDGRRDHNRPWRISQLINAHLRDCGIDGTAHQLRHSFGTALYAVSLDLRATGEAMGHASPSTTALYSRVARTTIRTAVLEAAELRVS